MNDRKRWIVDLSVIDPTWSNWTRPVVVKINKYRDEVIVNPAEALVFLRNSWPSNLTALAEHAAQLCSQVLRRRVSAEAARIAFLEAANEVNILYADHSLVCVDQVGLNAKDYPRQDFEDGCLNYIDL